MPSFMKENSDLIIYNASAGSGKTYALAKEYLKIIIQNPYDYNKILAVTFTKKATAEMKSRIIEYLSLLEEKNEKTDKLRHAIIDEIKMNKQQDISEVFDKHVRIALQLILHDYAHFNVSTIDSFFQGIIRAFAKELDLPIGMEVELDTQRVLQEAVQEILKAYTPEKDKFSRWIEDYVFDLIDDEKSWKLEKNITKLAKELLNEDYRLLTEDNQEKFDIETYRQVLDELKYIVSAYRKKIDEAITRITQKIKNDNLDVSFYFQGNKSIQSFINSTKNYEPEANSYIQKMLSGGALVSQANAKNEAVLSQLTNAWNSYLQPFIREMLQLKEQQQKRYNAAVLVLKNIYSLALLEYINTKVIEYKADKNLILISDANQIVSLIAKHEEVPFIFEKSASFLKYILIDEFQDTSTLQWKGFLPLLLELLQNVNGMVLIVGDPKQSIYRWRGGKMQLMTDGIAPDLLYHWNTRKNIILKHNYRSAKEIVAFNNAFFTTLKSTIQLDNKLFEQVLADVEQDVIKTEECGFVQCKWLEGTKEEEVQQQEIVQIIRSLEKHKKYSDIAILTRDNKIGADIAAFLQKNNIPVISSESLLLEHDSKIKLLIAALEYVLHSEEDFYAVKLNYLLSKFTNQENPELYLQKSDSLYWFEEKISLLKKNKVIQLRSISVNDLVFQLMRALEIDILNDNYLLRFQDIVHKYVQQYNNSLQEFLTYWYEQKEKLSIIPSEGLNAVKIFTIHKSKGLQFPVVILPNASWSMKAKSDSAIWIHSDEEPFVRLKAFPVEMNSKLQNSLFEEDYKKEMELTYIDNINLLYVAFTRAEEQLYILTKALKEDKSDELPHTVNRLLLSTLKQIKLPHSNFENNEFSYGKIEHKIKTADETIPLIYLQTQRYKDFKNELHLKTEEKYNKEQEEGNLLHEILEKINQKMKPDKAIAQTIDDADGYYKKEVKRILDFFESQQWLDENWQVLSERDVYYKGDLLKPDNVLISEQECIIIDYKTGAKKAEHRKQLIKYKEAYSSFITQNVKAYLLYTDTLELQEI